MAELAGQMTIFDALEDELGGEPSAARAIKILDTALELGWTENPFASLVIRLNRPDAKPFFARWDLSHNPETGKRSWRFKHAWASNTQPLAFGDIKTYLEDPSVIEPEMPDELAEAAEHEDPGQLVEGAIEALKPLTDPAPFDWGAFLS